VDRTAPLTVQHHTNVPGAVEARFVRTGVQFGVRQFVKDALVLAVGAFGGFVGAIDTRAQAQAAGVSATVFVGAGPRTALAVRLGLGVLLAFGAFDQRRHFAGLT
jgi:hypothetical protein